MVRASTPRHLVLMVVALTALCVALPQSVMAIDLSRLYGHLNAKRNGHYNELKSGWVEEKTMDVPQPGDACHPYEPFRCPGDGICISIQYLCDGAPDCPDGYDEDSRLCTAAKRPPVEETASFLQSLLASHGPNYLEKLFGSKARDALAPLGGVEKVAIALSESQTIEDFGTALHLMRSDLEHLRSVFMAVENGDLGMLKSLGIKDSELGDVKFFLEKLVNTGFLD
ncbi:IDLSRF-like peptide isoform X1 [Zootermopsis nevadensis]|uniref:IDLSRF-like peptide isoform X1 n=1 Tax=Zootermopsis nevadensis TaxID=136037 RepID=UPI000B8EA6C5|nr:IDLSRF-like peptide isoform X1 [Zootermopsis nevadensis]